MADSNRVNFQIAFRFKKKLLIPKFRNILDAKQFMMEGLDYGKKFVDMKLCGASDDAVDEILLGCELNSISQEFERLLECITGNEDVGDITDVAIAGENTGLLRAVASLVKKLINIGNIADDLKEKNMSGSDRCHWKRGAVFFVILFIFLLVAMLVNADKYSNWGILAAKMVLSFPFSAGWGVFDEYMRRRHLQPLGEKAQLADSIGNAARVIKRMGQEVFRDRNYSATSSVPT